MLNDEQKEATKNRIKSDILFLDKLYLSSRLDNETKKVIRTKICELINIFVKL